ncbi:hypothetical protein ABTE55_19250, partial [Acinetobacter baumannii]
MPAAVGGTASARGRVSGDGFPSLFVRLARRLIHHSPAVETARTGKTKGGMYLQLNTSAGVPVAFTTTRYSTALGLSSSP